MLSRKNEAITLNMRILWCITGGGHFLKECVEEIAKACRKHDVTLVASHAGEEVLRMYGLNRELPKTGAVVILEKKQGHSTPLSGSARFDVAVLAPCTANTCAKLVHGIADSAVTNIASQFLKRKVPLIVLPTDYQRKIETILPNGKRALVHCRSVDLKNIRALRNTRGITVVTSPEKLGKLLA